MTILIHLSKRRGVRYGVTLWDGKRAKRFGTFNTPEEAAFAEHRANISMHGPHYLPVMVTLWWLPNGGRCYLDKRSRQQFDSLQNAQLFRVQQRIAELKRKSPDA